MRLGINRGAPRASALAPSDRLRHWGESSSRSSEAALRGVRRLVWSLRAVADLEAVRDRIAYDSDSYAGHAMEGGFPTDRAQRPVTALIGPDRDNKVCRQTSTKND